MIDAKLKAELDAYLLPLLDRMRYSVQQKAADQVEQKLKHDMLDNMAWRLAALEAKINEK